VRSSRTGRFIARSTDRPVRARGVDVYLFPAVVGGGLGDIEEVLAAGRALARAGYRLTLLRLGGRPLPASVDGPWSWPPIARRPRVVRSAPAALTVSPSWGVSAAPSRPEPYGRGGAWEEESAAVERAYGARSTVHVSLEEFARTHSASEENRERFREGGVRSRSLAARLRASRAAGELDRLRSQYRRHRAFDRPNVLHLYATFRFDRGFAREFPEAVQTGPLWPRLAPARRRGPAGRRPREWVWYASPASAETIAPAVVDALRRATPPVHLYVRTDRPWRRDFARDRTTVARGPRDPGTWRRRFADAELRIVTGSRTLLEAMELGRPFLYFNGVLGAGSGRRRHRPEKLRAWLNLARSAGVPAGLRRDLGDFARGRRVRGVVENAVGRRGGWREFPRRLEPVGFRPPYDDAGRLLVRVAGALARSPDDATGVVARVRAGARVL
jgi:hypothetical protein